MTETEVISRLEQGIFVVACPRNARQNIVLAKGEKLVGCAALDRRDPERCVHLTQVYRGCPFVLKKKTLF